MPDPLISVVIVTYNSSQDIAACLAALQEVDYPRLEVIVVDNASSDGTADLVAASFPAARLVRSRANLGFAGGNNRGFTLCRGEIVLVLNPDVRLYPAAPAAFAAAFAADATMGVAGAKLLYPDGKTIQHAGAVVDLPLATTHHRGDGEQDSGQYDQPAAAEFVTGAALALRRSVIADLGGFDSGFYPAYYEDADLCYRARAAGWQVMYTPQAVGLHRTASTIAPASEAYYGFLHANRVRFALKHLSTRQLVSGFLPAEGERLQAPMPAADRLASYYTYDALWREHGEDHMEASQAGQAAAQERAAELERLVADLESRWLVREQPFVSRAPLIGRLIAAFRSTWNSVSTRWYVLPLLQQQVEFNGAVARAVAALAREISAQKTGSLAAPAIIGERLVALEERLQRLEDAQTSKSKAPRVVSKTP